MIMKIKQIAKIVSLILVGVLCSCRQSPEQALCEPVESARVFCGFQSPEDIEWLPDQSGLLVSEYGHMGSSQGRISVLDPLNGEITHLYGAGQKDANSSSYRWGDPACVEADFFSPHGFHLSQRPSGRHQLLVVNHRSAESEPVQDSIEMFELESIDGKAYLSWRGCIEAPAGHLLNDVSSAPGGLVATKMAETTALWPTVRNQLLGKTTARVMRWSLLDGWQEIEGVQGKLFNGIQWDKAKQQFLVSDWSRDRVEIYSSEGELKHTFEMEKPDNISFDAARGVYYVTGQIGSLWQLARCVNAAGAPCKSGYSIAEIDTNQADIRAALLLSSDGDYFGGGTTAVSDQNGGFYVGSFAGTRMLHARDGRQQKNIAP